MTDLSEHLLAEIEDEAARLAALAGAEIASTIGRSLAVRYKTGGEDETQMRNPVSEVDHHVESLIRSELAGRFPDHDIIGEEIDERPGANDDFIWVIDPVDGTSNFVNGFPIYSASIGVLHKGRPVAGAVWCSTSHALRPGVYHAREGGNLRFDAQTLHRPGKDQVKRRLVSVPPTVRGLKRWDVRKTGSAAIDCVFAAAGMLEVARFDRLSLWDVAGGAALGRAAGCTVMTRGKNGWEPLERFAAPDGDTGPGDLKHWRGAILIGQPDAIASGAFD